MLRNRETLSKRPGVRAAALGALVAQPCQTTQRPVGGFASALGNAFHILTANTVTGEFTTVHVFGMLAGLAFRINYLANAVQRRVDR